MKTTHLALLLAGIIPCVTGCRSPPTNPAPIGYLKVFTATTRVEVAVNTDFHPHVGYEIDDASGAKIRFVSNHTSSLDEAPSVVALPPGNYTIVAESTWRGLVKLPVVIQPGETTVIRLDGDPKL